MLLMDIPKLAPNRSIEIPFYHRPHLFLPQQRLMSMCLLPDTSLRSPSPAGSEVPELILAPFDFARWDHLWRFSATLVDREGLLRDIFQVVQLYGAEVMSSESGTSQEEGVHSIEAIFYIPSDRDVEKIEWHLGAQFCMDTSISSDSKLRLSLRRMETLFRAKQQYEKLSVNRDGRFHPHHESGVPTHFSPSEAGLRTIQIDLPLAMRSEISKHAIETRESFARIGRGQPECYQVRMSDTEDRCLRVTFLRVSDAVIHARLECKRDSSAPHLITQALARDRFNILSAFVTPASPDASSARTRIELLVRLECMPGSAEMPNAKSALGRTLASLPEELEITYGSPKNYRQIWKSSRVRPHKAIQTREISEDALTTQRVQHLESVKGDLEKHCAEALTDKDDWLRLNFVRGLCANSLNLFKKQMRPSIFISCHYKSPEEVLMLEKAARESNFHVMSGKNFAGGDLRGAIRHAIDVCDVFYGVWSRAGATGDGDDMWPSPWLIWEAGVAETLGLKMHLLVSDGIRRDVWRRIYPEVAITTFNEDNFEARARDQLKTIARGNIPRRASSFR